MRNLIWGMTAVVLAGGCGQKEPPPAPAASADGAATKQSTAPAPTSAPPTTPTTAAPSAPSALPPVSSRHRDLVARYLESDGHGGWRTNEKAATELEKLSPDDIAQLWPLLKDSQVEVRRGAAV